MSNMYENTRRKLSRIISEVLDIKSDLDRQEPIAGAYRADVQESSADLNWGTVALERALSSLKKCRK